MRPLMPYRNKKLKIVECLFLVWRNTGFNGVLSLDEGLQAVDTIFVVCPLGLRARNPEV